MKIGPAALLETIWQIGIGEQLLDWPPSDDGFLEPSIASPNEPFICAHGILSLVAYAIVVSVALIGAAQVKPIPAVLVLFIVPGSFLTAVFPGVHSDWAITAAAADSAALYVSLLLAVARVGRRFRRSQMIDGPFTRIELADADVCGRGAVGMTSAWLSRRTLICVAACIVVELPLSNRTRHGLELSWRN